MLSCRVAGKVGASNLGAMPVLVRSYTTQGLQEGAFQLLSSYRNLFKQDPTGQPVLCEYVMDRRAPTLTNSLSQTLGPERFKVSPGETIALRVIDAHPKAIHSCLRRADENNCLKPDEFRSSGIDFSLQAPASGEWCLVAFATDEVGHQSAPSSSCFIVYQDRELETIRSLYDNAKLLVEDDQLAAARSLLRAIKKFLGLETVLEKNAVEKEILAASIQVNAQIFERNRILVKDELLEMQALDPEGYIVAYDRKEIQLWSPDGQKLDAQPFANTRSDLKLSRLAVKKGLVLAFSDDQWILLRREGKRWMLPLVTRLNPLAKPGAVAWNPIQDEFAVLSRTSKEGIRIFSGVDGFYERRSRSLPQANATAASWSDSGQFLAAHDYNNFRIFRKDLQGKFVAALTQGEASLGFAFLARDERESFVFMSPEGLLKAWTPDQGIHALEANNGDHWSDYGGVSGLMLMKKTKGEAFVKRPDNIHILSIAEGKAVLKPFFAESPDFIPRHIADWSWNAERQMLSVVLNPVDQGRGFNFQETDDPSYWLVAQDITLSKESVQMMITLPSQPGSVSYDSGHGLRFWAQDALLGGFKVSNFASPFVKWWAEPGQAPQLLQFRFQRCSAVLETGRTFPGTPPACGGNVSGGAVRRDLESESGSRRVHRRGQRRVVWNSKGREPFSRIKRQRQRPQPRSSSPIKRRWSQGMRRPSVFGLRQ